MTAQQKQREDEVITHECVCMTAPCQAHSTVELETSVSRATCTRTHARPHAHSHIQMRRPVHTDGAPHCYRESSYCFRVKERHREREERGEAGGQQLCTCCISLVIQAECQQRHFGNRETIQESAQSSSVPLKREART